MSIQTKRPYDRRMAMTAPARRGKTVTILSDPMTYITLDGASTLRKARLRLARERRRQDPWRAVGEALSQAMRMTGTRRS